MIAFQDFVPRQLQPPALFSPGQYELIDQTVREANAWIAQHGVRVLNVETVVMPNINGPGGQGTGGAVVRTSGDMSSYWHQFVRVWYSVE